MSKKQATKSNNSREAEVQHAVEAMMNHISASFPKCPELKYSRQRDVDDIIWRVENSLPYQKEKCAEAKEKLDNAIFEETAIREKLERESVDEPNTTVYDSRRERAAQWHERMEMQLHGMELRLEAAIIVRDIIADE